MNTSRTLRIALLTAAAAVAAGCGGEQDELYARIDRVKATPGGRIEPLPQIKPAPTAEYTADDDQLRSPFVPDRPLAARSGAGGVEGPDPDRPRQFLEQFPLDSLAMVGTLEREGSTYALVQTRDGLVHRVQRGNYMGQNDGRIVEITDSEIRLVEIVSDGLGGYLERPAAVALSD
jgi:type IV pilus assembly protein PilP